MAEINNPNDPEKRRRRFDPRTTLPFFLIVLLLYLWQGYVTGNWTNGMSGHRVAMFYAFIAISAAYFIWIGVRFVSRSQVSKSE
jgi:hypothetical protein